MIEQGLSSAQVQQRVDAGQTNAAPDVRSRSLGDIVRANTFTWFNGLIGVLWVAMVLVAPIQDSLFGFVIVANTAIGVIQEWRASRTLAKLAVIGEAKPCVIRDGQQLHVFANEVVLDDIVVLNVGDQLVVDGPILQASGLEIDESLLTGEADPIHKRVDDVVFSGSFVVAGTGMYRASKVGANSFAAGLTEQAKQFHLTNSELRDSLDRFIKIISYLLIPVGTLLLISQLYRAHLPFKEALRGTIAGVVTMVPEGLVLLTSIAMAIAVIRLAQRRVLVQDMPAVEVLARVDTVCMDKTGTLTLPGMQVTESIALNGCDRDVIEQVLGCLAHIDQSGNPTVTAIAARFPDPHLTVDGQVPFSSARKWSAISIPGRGWWVMGAPEVLLSEAEHHVVLQQARQHAATGARVLMLGRAEQEPSAEHGVAALDPAALIVLDQQLRPDAAQTVAYFLGQGVHVKVISGDNAETVGAIALRAGVPGADTPIDARTLPADEHELVMAMSAASVFGRVTPTQKHAMVNALQSSGSTVAMTGDGVNDVLALKYADLGIAMGTGADATRAVAQLVLLDDQWSVMPNVVAEGRRVLGNIERVSDVFLTKTFYGMILSLTTAIFAVAFPLLPRHLSLLGALTIGIPGFFLALMPNTDRFRPGFFRRVVLFSAPAGVIAALCAFASYGLALHYGELLANAQSAATVTLFIVTTAVLTVSARPLIAIRIAIVALMVVMFLGVLYIPFLSKFFALSLEAEKYSVIAIAVGAVGALLVWVAGSITDRWRRA